MNFVLVSVVVTLVYFVLAAVVGVFISKKGKPYGPIKLVIHLILFLGVAAGMYFSIVKLHGVEGSKLYSMVSLHVLGLALLIGLISGVSLMIIKEVNQKLVLTHKLATLLMAVSIIAASVFLMVKI